MMWKYIYAAFLMIAFTACHTNKTLEKSDKPASTANYTLPEHLSVSASFRMFWDAWNADLRQSGNNLEKYVRIVDKKIFIAQSKWELSADRLLTHGCRFQGRESPPYRRTLYKIQ